MFNNATDFLALDFDGVIADSIRECLVVAHNAFTVFSEKEQKVSSLEELDDMRVSEFKRLRNFIRSGEDYVYIYLAIEKNTSINNQKDFDDFIEKHKVFKTDFFTNFYRERETLSTHQRELWIQLNPLYEKMKNFLLQCSYKDKVFIITTKKIFFVNQILLANEIHLEKKNLFHADDKRSKRAIISELLDEYNIQPENFYFIDDQIDTLLKVIDTGIHCYLAEWGYNNSEQISRAKIENVTTLTIQEFSDRFSDMHEEIC